MKRISCRRLLFGLLFCFCMIINASAAPARQNYTAGTADVPVLMYHRLYAGGGDKWTISPEAFEEDLRYLSENGWHSVGIADLAAFVDDGAPLPEKPVLLTFDDGYYNNLTRMTPLLEKYDMKAVISIIGEATDKWTEAGEISEKYGHLSWNQLNEMLATGRVELSNHTYNLHKNNGGRNGCAHKKGENIDSYSSMLREDIGKLQQEIFENCGEVPVCFAYPFGSRCPEALGILKDMGFRVTLSCYSGMNRLTAGDPDCLYDLRRCNRTPGKSARQILNGLTQQVR